jgi:hypothetical protein
MALIDPETNEVTLKIVYDGPTGSGKGTNLRWLHENADAESELIPAGDEQGLQLSLRPPGVETLRGMIPRLLLVVTKAPGEDHSRREALEGADGIVFVCDGRESARGANRKRLEALRRDIAGLEIDPGAPVVAQINRRDADDALPPGTVLKQLDLEGAPAFEAVATMGIGVLETLDSIMRLVAARLSGTAPEPGERPDPGPSREALFSEGAARAHVSGVCGAVPDDVDDSDSGDAELPDFHAVPGLLRTLLLADADASFRRRLADPLLARGFTVYEASDAEQAWREASRRRPWLIVADASLPGAEDAELWRRVRESTMTRNTLLVLVSEAGTRREQVAGLEIGADDFVSKRTSLRRLLLRLQLVLNRYSETEAAVAPETGMWGEIGTLGAPGVLLICARGHATGTLVARRSGDAHDVEVRFRDGDVIGARARGKLDEEAVQAFLSWTAGRFEFVPGDPGEGAPLGGGVEELVEAGCRRLDEEREAQRADSARA